MFIKKKTHLEADRRKKDRRRPGDQRFSGRLIDKKKGKERGSDRRKKDRRKG